VTGVQTITVIDAEADQRLDRWFKKHFPQINHGRLEKLLRTGQVRIDGKRAQASDRLVSGQSVRIPPLDLDPAAPGAEKHVSDRDAAELRRLIIYQDDVMIAINKPPGLAVQGGPGTLRHIDGMLDALRFDFDERPKLVHRLDRDTSGVLVLARTTRAAAFFSKAFQMKDSEKTYWAVVVGVPSPRDGRINSKLAKTGTQGRERVATVDEDGQNAITDYETIEHAWPKAAWLRLTPITGRTHQLRVHCASIGTPILGDGKYGGAGAFLPGSEIARQVHLHARELILPHPTGKPVKLTAELPPHMVKTFAYFGFEPGAGKKRA
jgi:23S rRNA pseudouridine955/2504/2580 synthase